eukprot:gene12385-14631_t
MHDVEAMYNYGRYDGGTIYIIRSRINVTDCIFQHSCTLGRGSAMCVADAEVAVTRSRMTDGNGYGGVGIAAGENTYLDLEDLYIAHNNGTAFGGGLYIYSGSFMALRNSYISENRLSINSKAAFTRGGGLYMTGYSTATVTDSLFENNLAGGGGGLAIGTDHPDVFIMNIRLVGCRAEEGGGLYLLPPFSSPRAVLSGLHFVKNQAQAGNNIYWVHTREVTNETEPLCLNCTADPATDNLLHTTAVVSAIYQDNQDVTNVGVVASSGDLFTPPMVFVSLDYYGSLANESGRSLSTVQVAIWDSTSTGWVGGRDIEPYYSGTGATFADFILHSTPGSTVKLKFSPSRTDWPLVNVTVKLRECVPGEQYMAEEETCKACPEDFVKWNNSTGACLDCRPYSDDLKCNGGSTFYVKQASTHASSWRDPPMFSRPSRCSNGDGKVSCRSDRGVLDKGSWLAPNAKYCRTSDCAVERLYSCPVEEACITETEESRSFSNLEELSKTEFCASVEYSAGVLCGGSIPPVCEEGYLLGWGNDYCTECPGKVLMTMQLCAVLMLFALVMYLLYWFFTKFTQEADKATPEEEMDMLEQTSGSYGAAQVAGTVSLMAGYAQVMAQMGSMYSTAFNPELFKILCNTLGVVVNINFSMLFNLKCAEHYLGVKGFMASYLFTLMQSILLPWFIILCFTLMYHLIMRRRRAQLALYQDVLKDEERNRQCFKTLWVICAVVSSFMILVFVFGFPLSLYLYMTYLRCYAKMVIGHKDAEVVKKMFETSEWHLCSPEERSYFDATGSISKFDPTLLTKEDRRKKDKKRMSILGMQWVTPSLKGSSVSARASLVAETIDAPKAEAEEQGHGGGGSQEATDAVAPLSYEEELTALVSAKMESVDSDTEKLRASRSSWAGSVSDQEQRPLEVYMMVGSFCDVSESEQALVGNVEREARNAYHEMLCYRLYSQDYMIRQADILMSCADMCLQVAMLEKLDVGDEGKQTIVPFTALDDNNKVLGQLVNPFEDEFYFWQCYEITRRLLQTGVVVVVETAFGTVWAITFALAVSFVALVLHVCYKPYISDRLDRLQGAILINQLAVQFVIMFLLADGEEDGDKPSVTAQVLGILLLLLQILIVYLAVSLVLPFFRPIASSVIDKVNERFSNFAGQYIHRRLRRYGTCEVESGQKHPPRFRTGSPGHGKTTSDSMDNSMMVLNPVAASEHWLDSTESSNYCMQDPEVNLTDDAVDGQKGAVAAEIGARSKAHGDNDVLLQEEDEHQESPAVIKTFNLDGAVAAEIGARRKAHGNDDVLLQEEDAHQESPAVVETWNLDGAVAAKIGSRSKAHGDNGMLLQEEDAHQESPAVVDTWNLNGAQAVESHGMRSNSSTLLHPALSNDAGHSCHVATSKGHNIIPFVSVVPLEQAKSSHQKGNKKNTAPTEATDEPNSREMEGVVIDYTAESLHHDIGWDVEEAFLSSIITKLGHEGGFSKGQV